MKAMLVALSPLALSFTMARPAAAQPGGGGWQRVTPSPEQDAEKAARVRHHDGVFFRQGVGVTLLRSRGRTDAVATQSGDAFSPVAQGQTRMRALSGPGVMAHAAIGGTPVPGLVFAFELTSHMFWNLDVETEDQPRVQPEDQSFQFFGPSREDAKYLSYGLLVLWYPQPTRGFNVGLSVALASAHLNGPTGWFAGPQLGYEWWIGEQWSIGALLKASFSGLSSGDQRSQFERSFLGGDSAYIAIPSLSGVVTFH